MARRTGKPVGRRSGFPGFQRPGSSLRAPERDLSGDRPVSNLRRCRLVGHAGRDCECASPTLADEATQLRRWSKASKLAKKLSDSWSMIQPSDALRAMSIQLVDRYDLRAADSLQLAAALAWCEDAPQDRVFLTADQKLRESARLSGFDAKEI